jgi:heme-degrading monooxygenase HmoA
MYARHVSLNLKPNQREEFNQTFEKDILPLLQKQNGFTDEITFVSPDGKDCIAISLWERKENADVYSRETYPQVLKSLARVVEGTPEVRGYEVANSTFHKTAATH